MSLTELRFGKDKFSRKDMSFLARTIDYAYKSKCTQRHAAFVCRGNRILARSTNKYHNDPKHFPRHMFNSEMDSIGVHAEIAAMSKVDPKKLKGATIYVARIMPSGSPGLSRPCKRCEEALIHAGVRKVIYSDTVVSESVLVD